MSDPKKSKKTTTIKLTTEPSEENLDEEFETSSNLPKGNFLPENNQNFTDSNSTLSSGSFNTPDEKGEDEKINDLDDGIIELDKIIALQTIKQAKNILANPKNTDSKAYLSILKQMRNELAQSGPNNQVNVIGFEPQQPKSFSAVAYLGFPCDPNWFSEKAFNVLDTRSLLEELSKIKQVKDPNSIEAENITDIFAIQVMENGDKKTLRPDEEGFYNKIEELRVVIRDNHYLGIAALAFAHLYLWKHYTKTKEAILLLYLKTLETAVLNFNQYDAGLCLRLEDNMLKKIRNLEGLISEIKNYFVKKVSKGVGADLSKNEASNSSSEKDQPIVTSLEFSQNPETLISMLDEISDKSKKISSKTSEKDNSKIKIFAIGTENLEINVSNMTEPIIFFEEVQKVLTAVIQTGLATIAQARDLGKQLNYNIYTNAWGSFAVVDMNEAYIEKFIVSMWKQLPEFQKDRKFLVPKFYIKYYYRFVSFLSGIGFSPEVLYNLSLLPGEHQEIRIKTTETRRTTREQSRSVLDSTSKSNKDALTTTKQEDKQTGSSKMNNHSDYIDSGVNGKAGYEGVKVCASIEASSKWGATNATQEVNTAATNNLLNTVEENIEETTSKCDITITETSKEEMETTHEEGITRIIDNINKVAVLNVKFHKIIQNYLGFCVLEDITIILANGKLVDEFSFGELEDRLDKYLKTKENSIRNKIKENLINACIVTDYRDRPISLLDPTLMKIRKDNYMSLLGTSEKTKPDIDDLSHEDQFLNIFGIVMKAKKFTKPTGGVGASPSISSGKALDPIKEKEVKNTLLEGEGRAKEAVARAKRLEVENDRYEKETELYLKKYELEIAKEQSMNKFLDAITDTKERIEAYFKLQKDLKSAVDKVIVGKMIKDKDDSDHPIHL